MLLSKDWWDDSDSEEEDGAQEQLSAASVGTTVPARRRCCVVAVVSSLIEDSQGPEGLTGPHECYHNPLSWEAHAMKFTKAQFLWRSCVDFAAFERLHDILP
jgi:hypothetical protein